MIYCTCLDTLHYDTFKRNFVLLYRVNYDSIKKLLVYVCTLFPMILLKKADGTFLYPLHYDI